MAKNYEWSENFDAVAWHLARMSKPDYDDYYDYYHDHSHYCWFLPLSCPHR